MGLKSGVARGDADTLPAGDDGAMTPQVRAQADAPDEVEPAAFGAGELPAEAVAVAAPESAGLLAAGAEAGALSLLADSLAAPVSAPAGLSDALSPAASPLSAAPSAPAFFWPPSRKSVTYQPDPFNWKAGAVSFRAKPFPLHDGQTVSGASDSFCS